MTNDGNLDIPTVLFNYQFLLYPVPQHHIHRILGNTRTLYGCRLHKGIISRKRVAKQTENSIILALART